MTGVDIFLKVWYLFWLAQKIKITRTFFILKNFIDAKSRFRSRSEKNCEIAKELLLKALRWPESERRWFFYFFSYQYPKFLLIRKQEKNENSEFLFFQESKLCWIVIFWDLIKNVSYIYLQRYFLLFILYLNVNQWLEFINIY